MWFDRLRFRIFNPQSDKDGNTHLFDWSLIYSWNTKLRYVVHLWSEVFADILILNLGGNCQKLSLKSSSFYHIVTLPSVPNPSLFFVKKNSNMAYKNSTSWQIWDNVIVLLTTSKLFNHSQSTPISLLVFSFHNLLWVLSSHLSSSNQSYINMVSSKGRSSFDACPEQTLLLKELSSYSCPDSFIRFCRKYITLQHNHNSIAAHSINLTPLVIGTVHGLLPCSAYVEVLKWKKESVFSIKKLLNSNAATLFINLPPPTFSS
jgi:hypothetical protein